MQTIKNLDSLSEDRGLELIHEHMHQIYSVGISTAGRAEIRMAKAHPQSKIIATTLDSKGAQQTQRLVAKEGLEKQIEIKIEDVASQLPYSDEEFDYIYARLVLHYLSLQQLVQALSELYRILKKNSKIFIVIISRESRYLQDHDKTFDAATGLTTLNIGGSNYSRCLHNLGSIKEYLCKVGFHIESEQEYEEYLCSDYQRQKPALHPTPLIEVIAIKPE